jgi:hypothetical protein
VQEAADHGAYVNPRGWPGCLSVWLQLDSTGAAFAAIGSSSGWRALGRSNRSLDHTEPTSPQRNTGTKPPINPPQAIQPFGEGLGGEALQERLLHLLDVQAYYVFEGATVEPGEGGVDAPSSYFFFFLSSFFFESIISLALL